MNIMGLGSFENVILDLMESLRTSSTSSQLLLNPQTRVLTLHILLCVMKYYNCILDEDQNGRTLRPSFVGLFQLK